MFRIKKLQGECKQLRETLEEQSSEFLEARKAERHWSSGSFRRYCGRAGDRRVHKEESSSSGDIPGCRWGRAAG